MLVICEHKCYKVHPSAPPFSPTASHKKNSSDATGQGLVWGFYDLQIIKNIYNLCLPAYIAAGSYFTLWVV